MLFPPRRLALFPFTCFLIASPCVLEAHTDESAATYLHSWWSWEQLSDSGCCFLFRTSPVPGSQSHSNSCFSVQGRRECTNGNPTPAFPTTFKIVWWEFGGWDGSSDETKRGGHCSSPQRDASTIIFTEDDATQDKLPNTMPWQRATARLDWANNNTECQAKPKFK